MTPEQWDQLLSEFGNIAGQVYQAAARQTAFEAWFAFVLTMLLLVIGAVLLVWLIRDKRRNGDGEDVLTILLVGWAIFTPFIFFFAVPLFVTFWVNPEWAILKTLASLVR